MINKCNVAYCRNIVTQGSKCSKCIKREYRKRNPMKAAFQNLRANASRRGKDFSLTFEQFKNFAIATNYIAGKGRQRNSFHIDRIREDEGYHINNIQVLTNHENLKKYHHLKYNKDERGVPVNYWVEPLCAPFDPNAFVDVPF